MRRGFGRPRLFGLLAVASYRARYRPRRVDRRLGLDHVYVIKGEHGRVKIGSSINPDQRCAELQTGSPFRLWVDYRIAVSGRAADVEFAAHDILDARRGLGEWFEVPTEAAIAAIHAAAFRLGVTLNGEAISLPRPDWQNRLTVAVCLAAPFWFGLAADRPVLAAAYGSVAMIGANIAILRNGPDAERPAGNLFRWCAIVIGGGLIPMLPALVMASILRAP